MLTWTSCHSAGQLSIAVAAALSAGCARNATLPAAEIPGLPPAGALAVMFAPGVVSTGDVFASTFTPDGRTVVFTKFSPPRMTLMMSRIVAGQWTVAQALPFSGAYRDLDPSFSPDGSRLYFSSWRPTGPSPGDTTNAADTWYVDRSGDGWSVPVRLAEPVNGAEVDMYPSVTARGVLYFDSFRSRPRRRLVYRAEPHGDGTFAVPQALDPIINADSGALDLYISTRTASGTWTEPRNLGPTVNTAGTEFCPFVSRDGRFLFFTRISSPNVTPTTRNIYVVRFDDLRSARPSSP